MMRKTRSASAALIVALAVALPAPAFSQAPAPDSIWGEVPAQVRANHIVGSAALQDTAVDRTIATVPVGDDGRFVFGNVPPGKYVVRVMNTNGETVATGCLVTLNVGGQERADFGCDKPAAAVPHSGINKTVLIVAGAAAVGIAAVVALSGGKEPASPSR